VQPIRSDLTMIKQDIKQIINPMSLSDPANPKIIANGEVPLVSYEKMSKSKYNGTDPNVCYSFIM
jgi:leucyl-tRNA synthetase